jgi:hypothetical protein
MIYITVYTIWWVWHLVAPHLSNRRSILGTCADYGLSELLMLPSDINSWHWRYTLRVWRLGEPKLWDTELYLMNKSIYFQVYHVICIYIYIVCIYIYGIMNSPLSGLKNKLENFIAIYSNHMSCNHQPTAKNQIITTASRTIHYTDPIGHQTLSISPIQSSQLSKHIKTNHVTSTLRVRIYIYISLSCRYGSELLVSVTTVNIIQ